MSITKAKKYAEQGDYESAYHELLSFLETPDDWEWLQDWQQMWPTEGEVYNDSGRTLGYSPRQAINTVLTRMKGYMKDMPKIFPNIPKKDRIDRIMRATEMYLRDKEDVGWEYVKKNVKFIQDNNGSTLSEYISKTEKEEHKQNAKLNW